MLLYDSSHFVPGSPDDVDRLFQERGENTTESAVLVEFWPELMVLFDLHCPECGWICSQDENLCSIKACMLTHLNDTHRWSFSQIADLLDELVARS